LTFESTLILLANTVVASAQTPLTNLTPWQQFGLAGLVIGALFCLVGWLIHANSKERKETRDDHREERKEWIEASNRNTDKVETVIKELTVAIRERKQ